MTGNKGFTLIELLTAVTVFAVVMISLVGLFGSALSYQKEMMIKAEVLNGASYAMDYMSRALRMAQRDITGNCVGESNTYTNPVDTGRIRFLNYDGRCQEFRLLSEAIQVRKSTDNSYFNLNGGEELTSSRLKIEDLSFIISGNDPLDNLQPKVAFSLQIKSQEIDFNSLYVQTLISQRERRYDTPY